VFFGLVGLMLATPATVVLLIAVQQLYVRDVLGDAT
jgi:predicted PurR-regulated permease PerM